ncbi:LIP5 [Symbiodinium necroappetens]|uniref:LIP5 protein n=1 Tax=Symbiodinium necroappetens TaxID=1628268 RepID=A0A812X0W1_9DINO|nr:LIP5 [Symbiodinium necroappetens]
MSDPSAWSGRIGVLNAELSLFSLSLSRGDRDHAAGYRDYASLKLRALPLRVLIGSRWPLFALLTSKRLRWYAPAEGSPDLTNDTVINCEHLAEPALNWHGYLDAFRPDAVKDWYNATIRYVMSWQMTQIPQELYKECPLGFITTMLIKAITCATTESSCFDSFAGKAESFLKSSPHMLDLLAHSRWPLATLLNFLATTARHQYFLDFTEDELSGNLSPLILSQSTTFVAAMGNWLGSLHKAGQHCFRDLAAVLPKLGPAWEEAPNLVYITMIYGAKFNRYMRRFCARARSVGLVGERLLIFTLDQEAFELCLVENGQRCIRGTPSIMNKFTLPLMCAHLGLDTVWIDLDVFLMVDPTPALLEHAERGPYDLLVSGSFEADCICNGIVYFRSTRVVVDWLLSVLVWMYHHPYEHDQKTFSAFLNYTERVSKDDLDLPQIPLWDTLDPINQFVTPDTFEGNGWTGDLENIVIYHFLNGEASGEEKNLLLAELQKAEDVKKSLNISSSDGQGTVESFALRVFDAADASDRSARDKTGQAAAVSKLYAAALFLDVCAQFHDGELPPDLAEKARYARFRVVQIREGLKQGIPSYPNDPGAASGSLGEESETAVAGPSAAYAASPAAPAAPCPPVAQCPSPMPAGFAPQGTGPVRDKAREQLELASSALDFRDVATARKYSFVERSEKRDHEAKRRMRQYGHFTDAGGAAPGKCEGESYRSGKAALDLVMISGCYAWHHLWRRLQGPGVSRAAEQHSVVLEVPYAYVLICSKEAMLRAGNKRTLFAS